jgi:VanZ family protein
MMYRHLLTGAGGLLWHWLPPLGWMAVIFFMSSDHLSFPELRRTWTGFLAAKAAHLLEYALLSLLWYRAISGKLITWHPRAALLGFVAGSSYAVLDEVHQSFTTYRGATMKDVLLDASGAALAILAIWVTLHLWTLRGGSPMPSGQPPPRGSWERSD